MKKYTLTDFIQGITNNTISKKEANYIWSKVDEGTKAYQEDVLKMSDEDLYNHVYDGHYDPNDFATKELLKRDLNKFHVGDVVSEIENHTNERKDCIHTIVYIRPFPHGQYMEIGLSGYTDEDRETETFNEFDVYELPLSLALANER